MPPEEGSNYNVSLERQKGLRPKQIINKLKEAEEERTFIKGLGFCSFGIGSNPATVDVKNGKIRRIKPLRYDWKYQPEEFNPWKIEARDQTFEPAMKSLLPPFSLACFGIMRSEVQILSPRP